MEQTPRGRLTNTIAAGVLLALIGLGLIICVGARLSSDWSTIWTAVTAIGAFVALAALFAAAIYSREQYHATLEASRLETQRANDQIEADRQNAALAAADSRAQLEEAKSANKATQDFERVRLTREVLKEHTDLTNRILKTFDTNWALTKSKNDALLATADPERVKMRNEAYIAISDCSALLCGGRSQQRYLHATRIVVDSTLMVYVWNLPRADLHRWWCPPGVREPLVHGAVRFVEE